jgi:uncharacterized membrane protein
MGYYHPQFVHFAIALLVVGVAFRAVSVFGTRAASAPAAAIPPMSSSHCSPV